MIRIRNFIDGGSFGTFFPNIQVVKNLPNFVEYMRRREETGESCAETCFGGMINKEASRLAFTDYKTVVLQKVCFTVLLCLIFLLCRLIVSDKANRVKE